MRKTILILVIPVSLWACSNSGYNNLDDAIEGESCEVEYHGEEKWFATDEVHCADGTVISWHANEGDRNMYADFVEGFLDITPNEQGPRYNIYRD